MTKNGLFKQALPFQTRMINGNYNIRAYQLAMNNTKYNNEGIAIVDKDNEKYLLMHFYLNMMFKKYKIDIYRGYNTYETTIW